MDTETITNLISTVGFPIACVIALGGFMAIFLKKYMEDSKAREDKLTKELANSQEVNKKAIETIALYADRLTHIEVDVADIKETVTEIKLTKEK